MEETAHEQEYDIIEPEKEVIVKNENNMELQ